MRVNFDQTFEPNRAGFFVPMFNGAAAHCNFIWAHGGVAHHNNAVVTAIFMENIPRWRHLAHAADIVFPNLFIEAIVKVEIFETFKFTASGGE